MVRQEARGGRAGAVCVAGLLLAGCGAKEFRLSKAPEMPFNTFGRVDVRELRNKVELPKELDADDQKAFQAFVAGFPNRLREEIAKRGVFRVPEGKKLVVESSLIEFDPGSGSARYWVGFGAGEGKIRVNVDFKDELGNVVAQGQAVGGVSGGWGGGSLDDAMERLVDSIADFVRDNYERVR